VVVESLLLHFFKIEDNYMPQFIPPIDTNLLLELIRSKRGQTPLGLVGQGLGVAGDVISSIKQGRQRKEERGQQQQQQNIENVLKTIAASSQASRAGLDVTGLEGLMQGSGVQIRPQQQQRIGKNFVKLTPQKRNAVKKLTGVDFGDFVTSGTDRLITQAIINKDKKDLKSISAREKKENDITKQLINFNNKRIQDILKLDPTDLTSRDKQELIRRQEIVNSLLPPELQFDVLTLQDLEADPKGFWSGLKVGVRKAEGFIRNFLTGSTSASVSKSVVEKKLKKNITKPKIDIGI
jgi:hypothetical protein